MSTLELWKEEFITQNKNKEEEVGEVMGAISNERLWSKGSSDAEQSAMHEDNIVLLEEYLAWLEER